MFTENQAGTSSTMRRQGLRVPLTTVCAVLLAAGAWLPAHGKSGSSGPVMLAAASEKSAEEVERALALTHAQRLLVQKGLNAMGFDAGTADGIFGPRTRSAVAKWQAARGEVPTGFLDAKGAQRLIAVGSRPVRQQITFEPSRRMYAVKDSTVHAGPGRQFRQIGPLYSAEVVQVLGRIGNWFRLAPKGAEMNRFAYGPLLKEAQTNKRNVQTT